MSAAFLRHCSSQPFSCVNLHLPQPWTPQIGNLSSSSPYHGVFAVADWLRQLPGSIAEFLGDAAVDYFQQVICLQQCHVHAPFPSGMGAFGLCYSFCAASAQDTEKEALSQVSSTAWTLQHSIPCGSMKSGSAAAGPVPASDHLAQSLGLRVGSLMLTAQDGGQQKGWLS